jgi:hypothetical protein
VIIGNQIIIVRDEKAYARIRRNRFRSS